MDELVRWLGVQLDEDDRIAREAGGLAWYRPAEYLGDPAAIRDSEQERVVCYEGWPSEGQAVHIAEWDPARVLREVEAKRAIVSDLADVIEAGENYKGPDYYEGVDACERTLKRLALSYADRSGYRQEWAP